MNSKFKNLNLNPPPNVKQFLVARNVRNYADILQTINQYQEHIETDTVQNVFKNLSFSDDLCKLCDKQHNVARCPMLRSSVESEVQTQTAEKTAQHDTDTRRDHSRDRHSQSPNYRDESPYHGNRDESPYHGNRRYRSTSPYCGKSPQ